MIVRESISFERGGDPKEVLFGIRPGTFVTNNRRWNGTSIMIEVFLRTPTAEDLRRWDPLHEHTNDKHVTYQFGLLQDAFNDMPSTFFPSGFSGFSIVFESDDLRKLTEEEKEIVLRGLTEGTRQKEVKETLSEIERWTGVKPIIPEIGKK